VKDCPWGPSHIQGCGTGFGNVDADKSGTRQQLGFEAGTSAGPVLEGVVPGQPMAVVHRAAEFAYTLNVKLICAYVHVLTAREERADFVPGTAWFGG
jgi:enolase